MASLDSAGLLSEHWIGLSVDPLLVSVVTLLFVSFVSFVCAVRAAARGWMRALRARHRRRAVAEESCSGEADGGSGTRRAGGDTYLRLDQVKPLQEEQAEQLRAVRAEHEATTRTLLLRIARLEDKVADACLDSPLHRTSLAKGLPSTRTSPTGAPTCSLKTATMSKRKTPVTPSSGCRFDAQVRVGANQVDSLERASGPSRVDRPRAHSTGAASSAQPRVHSTGTTPARMATSDRSTPSSERLFSGDRREAAEQASGPSRADRPRARSAGTAWMGRIGANDCDGLSPPTPISSRAEHVMSVTL
eukprot:Tamp_16552.p1 GENE.Tamp_16552~~Tamp_16552.p1  ORF type:complete len:304 (-),score=23.50 Tamp_16552:435-1346(-)